MTKKKQPEPSNITDLKQSLIKGMRLQQKRFAEYYVICGNKTEAAIKAGYAPKNASWVGSTLSRNDKVRAYIDYLLKDQNDDISASIEEARRRMSKALRGELTEQVIVMTWEKRTSYDKNGKRVTKQVQVPRVIEKQICIRDQIEASKHYTDLLKIETKHVDLEETQDDKLRKALDNRAEAIGSSAITTPASEIVFEQGERKQGDNGDADDK